MQTPQHQQTKKKKVSFNNVQTEHEPTTTEVEVEEKKSRSNLGIKCSYD